MAIGVFMLLGVSLLPPPARSETGWGAGVALGVHLPKENVSRDDDRDWAYVLEPYLAFGRGIEEGRWGVFELRIPIYSFIKLRNTEDNQKIVLWAPQLRYYLNFYWPIQLYLGGGGGVGVSQGEKNLTYSAIGGLNWAIDRDHGDFFRFEYRHTWVKSVVPFKDASGVVQKGEPMDLQGHQVLFEMVGYWD